MISLQSHNQVLHYLTQFTSAITPKSITFAIQVQKQSNSSKIKTTDTILKKNKYSKINEKCSYFTFDQSDIENLTLPLRLFKSDAWQVLEKLSKNDNIKIPISNNKWKVSYISSTSFTKNKNGSYSRSFLDQDNMSSIFFHIKPDCRFRKKCLSTTLQPYNIQFRCFKTDRNIKAELNRNPTLITRIRKWFGLNTKYDHNREGLISDKMNGILLSREYTDLNKLKKFQGDKYIKLDEVQHIKAAFVEGYLAGHGQKPRGRAQIFFKMLQQVFTALPFLVLIVFIMATTGGSMFKIQIGNRLQVDPEEINVTFNDVKGVEEAKSELMDVVEFLKNPDKFSALGGKLPKGVLLVGPPGTGKTLLARAVAGEAGVPFFHAAGPEFDEVLVGQGARRVRDLFRAAKERAPCVIFIDEIDSVGAKRTNSALHPYANQTINQLLSEMDGFHQNEGVIVLGATNRRQDLDKALLRPGRFDTEIVVNKPDFLGRKEILNLYLNRILTHDVNADILAKRTIGFTGADIENMINQAALRAAIEGAEYVTMHHLERARDKVIMGPEGKRKVINEEDNHITAYHEAGHALVSYYTKDAVPLHKVTIIPRGQSLGHTSFLPEKDMYHMTKAHMLASMDSCMGGRAAEELIFGQDRITSGASVDFLNATQTAEAMVKTYGMSEKVGFRVHRDMNRSGYSTSTRELIDNEVKRLLQESYDRAKTILKIHSKEHKLLAEALLKYETLDAEDVKAIINGKNLRHEAKKDINRTIVDVPNKSIM
ncbi:ATP-dependent zinc metalloprotease YME1L [Phymastichus coffea]|uniref:ATP-dependent zinc metalloprotease YME1L n=1 Tax=Phymastichus coffea TaxID=108790 RepID=UPI00273B935C|nr:ATP-dependent zinc metalloprotease YME1L [Phymastichus coffea]